MVRRASYFVCPLGLWKTIRCQSVESNIRSVHAAIDMSASRHACTKSSLLAFLSHLNNLL